MKVNEILVHIQHFYRKVYIEDCSIILWGKMRIRLQKYKSKKDKGLSGAVTALILVIASVAIAIVVIGFVFGIFGAVTSTPTVTAAGTGSISSGNLIVVLESTGSVKIVSVSVDGYTTSVSQTLTTGSNPLTIALPSGFTSILSSSKPGEVYTIDLGLNDGQSVAVSAVLQSSSSWQGLVVVALAAVYNSGHS